MTAQIPSHEVTLSDERRARELLDCERKVRNRTLRRMGCDIGYAATYIDPEHEWKEMIEKAGEMRARIRAMRKASDEAFWKTV